MAFYMSSLVLMRESFISVVFLVFSLVFSCCASVFLEILLYLILSPVLVFVQKLSEHNEEEQSH